MPSHDEPMLVLKPPQRPGLALFATLSGACTAVGFFGAMLPVPHFLAWVALGFTGVAGLCSASFLLPGNSALVLTAEGFTLRFGSGAVFYPWSDVDYFAVAGPRLVVFRLLDTSDRVSPVARQMTGFDGALPARYGTLPAEVLAARLNECRHQFGENEQD
ncbi:MAG TPA: hypothetical protein VHC22_17630 [Pirellulales bacterium]|nr:hypothetical protein [Pirellulales bacterium]